MIFFWHDRPRVGGPTCSTPPGGHYKTKINWGLYGFFVAQPLFCWSKKNFETREIIPIIDSESFIKVCVIKIIV